jgi:hypothetical protein
MHRSLAISCCARSSVVRGVLTVVLSRAPSAAPVTPVESDASPVTRACLVVAVLVSAVVGQYQQTSLLQVLPVRRLTLWEVGKDHSLDVCFAVCSYGHVPSLPGV